MSAIPSPTISSGQARGPVAADHGPPGVPAGYLAQPSRRVFGGTPAAIAKARAFTREVLGPVPALDDVVLLVSELCSNAILHTATGHGGTFEVAIWPSPTGVMVSVSDNGSDQQPVVRSAEPGVIGGRGLWLVAKLAGQWDYSGGRNGRVVTFCMRWSPQA